MSAPSSVNRPGPTPSVDGIRRWCDLMEACEQFLLAGLRRKIGPDGDLVAAHREWYARQMEEHDRMIIHMCEELSRRFGDHGK